MAFAELTSHLMLTELSADDPFNKMVNLPPKEIRLYNIKGDKSAIVRLEVHKLMTRDRWSKGQIFDEKRKLRKRKNPGDTAQAQDIIAQRLDHSIPRHLIPTGMLGLEDAFENGHWLKERVTHLKSYAQRQKEVKQLKDNYLGGRSESGLSLAEKAELANRLNLLDKATDTDTRLVVMRGGLEILNLMATITKKPEAGLKELGDLKARLLIHYKVNLKAAGYVTDVDGFLACNKYFDYISDGSRVVREDEWASQAMEEMCEVFVFVRSFPDGYCGTPVTPKKLSEFAKDILSQLPQTEEEAYLGWNSNIREAHRSRFVTFMNQLWTNSFEVIMAVGRGYKPQDYPKWYSMGVSANSEKVELAKESLKSDKNKVAPVNYWKFVKNEIGLRG